jgi:archaemetzincin
LEKIIFIQQIGEINQATLTKLKINLKNSFKEFIDKVKISPDAIPLENSDYDESRRQYNASSIIRKLIKHVNNQKNFRTLGIMDNDIYTRQLNFVFGIAIVPKPQFMKSEGVALISITRLKETFYRRKEDKNLFDFRVLKEAIHELGHTFGLKHCDNHCIMRFSNHLADTDRKPPEFCESCQRELDLFIDTIK